MTKKITKIFMTLILSGVMMFGCLPYFTNEANAVDIITIDEVYITYTGFLATNAQTLKYTVPSGAHYSLSEDDNPKLGWYKDDGFNTIQDFSNTGNAYKKLTIRPESGYQFASNFKLYINGEERFNHGVINPEGTITYIVQTIVQVGTISLDFNKPTTYSNFLELQKDRSEFTMGGKEFDTENGFIAKDVSQVSGDDKDKGYFYLIFTYSFDDETEFNKIKMYRYRNNEDSSNIHDGVTNEDLLNMNVGDIYCYKNTEDGKKQLIIYEKYDFRINATITHDPIRSLMQLYNPENKKIDFDLIHPSVYGAKKHNFSMLPIFSFSNDARDAGKFIVIISLSFGTEEEQQAVNSLMLNGINIKTKENKINYASDNIAEVLNFIKTHKVGWYTDKKGENYKVCVGEILDLGLSPSVSINTSVGTTAKTVFETISAKINEQDISNIDIVEIMEMQGNGSSSSLDKDNEEDMFEKDKTYVVKFKINEPDSVAYKSINVNGQTLKLTLDTTDDVTQLYNKYTYNQTEGYVLCYYKYVGGQSTSTSGSKKYKTSTTSNSSNAVEKISGTGKKGSTRTITPVEGKKTLSVIVKDKDGNIIDVTANADGTYSFIQPASNVSIEVIYKNREITLNIGSTKADVDGERSNLDVCPVIRNDRTMLPIRFIAENLGAKVEWDETNPNYVVIARGDTKIEIILGSDIMLVNGKEVILDSVAFAENDRTYLPVRAISEALNAVVEWNEAKPMEVKIYER